MNKAFERYRWIGHRLVGGWLAPEVLAVLAILDSVQRSKGIGGAVAEIGVHHGKLFLGLKLLQRNGESSVAIDVFDDQLQNIDQSGRGDLAIFRNNVERWSSLTDVAIHQGDSTKLTVSTLYDLAKSKIRLFSVDGGHTESIVFSDMTLADESLAEEGVVIADDVFNEQWPEVLAGTLRYMNEGTHLVPFAIGFNKVFFARVPFAEFYRDILTGRFDANLLVTTKISSFMGHEVLVMTRTPRNRVREWHNYRH